MCYITWWGKKCAMCPGGRYVAVRSAGLRPSSCSRTWQRTSVMGFDWLSGSRDYIWKGREDWKMTQLSVFQSALARIICWQNEQFRWGVGAEKHWDGLEDLSATDSVIALTRQKRTIFLWIVLKMYRVTSLHCQELKQFRLKRSYFAYFTKSLLCLWCAKQ